MVSRAWDDVNRNAGAKDWTAAKEWRLTSSVTSRLGEDFILADLSLIIICSEDKQYIDLSHRKE